MNLNIYNIKEKIKENLKIYKNNDLSPEEKDSHMLTQDWETIGQDFPVQTNCRKVNQDN